MKAKQLIVLVLLAILALSIFACGGGEETRPTPMPSPSPAVAPNTIGTSTDDYATLRPAQRKTFYASGRYWVFYADGSNMVYRTSENGTSWSSATTVRSCTWGHRFDTWFDGTYVHYAYTPDNPGGALVYRRGTPNGDGTITWSAVEQTTYQTDAHTICNPSVVADTNGNPWVMFLRYDGSNRRPYVTKSSATDGTWLDAEGFPYELDATISGYYHTTIVPLTGGKVYCVWADANTKYFGKLWDGSSWSGRETISSSDNFTCYKRSVVNDGDDVHLAFLTKTDYDIVYVKRTYGSGWGSEVVLASSVAGSAPVLAITNSGTIYCFWCVSNHIQYIKCVGSTWDVGATDWITEAEAFPAGDTLTCSYRDNKDSVIGVAYMSGSSSPYNIKFAGLETQ
jgi:hypothetical protein